MPIPSMDNKSSKQSTHTCKLCLRHFASGRALGGHLRMHNRRNSTASSSSSSGSGYVHRAASPDPELSSVAVPNRDPETESESENGFLKKRCRNEEVASSASGDTTTDEDVAFCLVMLSRDVWFQELDQEVRSATAAKTVVELATPKARSRYQCSTCLKTFRSYQALGGHRASHNKSKPCNQRNSDHLRTHECPFCFRVFSSGQALGGHKRSHLVAGDRRNTAGRFIDLNLPAPADECESYIDVSALSDAEP